LVTRGEIYWARINGSAGRRPVLVLSRDRAIPVLHRLLVAPISRTVRGIPTEVPIGAEEGLDREAAASCDDLLTIPKDWLEPSPIGALSHPKMLLLDQALRFALDGR